MLSKGQNTVFNLIILSANMIFFFNAFVAHQFCDGECHAD